MSGLSAKSKAADKGRVVTGTGACVGSFTAGPASSIDAAAGTLEATGGAAGGCDTAAAVAAGRAACGGISIPAGKPGIESPGFHPSGMGGKLLRISARFPGGAVRSCLPAGGAVASSGGGAAYAAALVSVF